MTKDNLKNRLEELFTQSAQEEAHPERPEESAPPRPEAAPPGIAGSASGDTALAAGVDYRLIPTDVAEGKPPPSLSGGKQAEEEREQLLADLARRALQLQTAAEVSRAASSLLSLDDLLRFLGREMYNLAEGIRHETEVK